MRTGTNALIVLVGLCALLATGCSQARLEGAAAAPVGNPGAADFFVSPQGKDSWSGKRADPGQARTAGENPSAFRRRAHVGLDSFQPPICNRLDDQPGESRVPEHIVDGSRGANDGRHRNGLDGGGRLCHVTHNQDPGLRG